MEPIRPFRSWARDVTPVRAIRVPFDLEDCQERELVVSRSGPGEPRIAHTWPTDFGTAAARGAREDLGLLESDSRHSERRDTRPLNHVLRYGWLVYQTSHAVSGRVRFSQPGAPSLSRSLSCT